MIKLTREANKATCFILASEFRPKDSINEEFGLLPVFFAEVEKGKRAAAPSKGTINNNCNIVVNNIYFRLKPRQISQGVKILYFKEKEQETNLVDSMCTIVNNCTQAG